MGARRSHGGSGYLSGPAAGAGLGRWCIYVYGCGTEQGHLQQFGEAITSKLGPIDFAGLAESLGARGLRAKSGAELEQALRDGLAHSGVTVIHARITGGNP